MGIMLQRTLPAGFIAPCLPTKTDKLPSGSQWLHEIKHDGFRIIARKNGERVRLYSRPGNDLTRRFPLIVETMSNTPLSSQATASSSMMQERERKRDRPAVYQSRHYRVRPAALRGPGCWRRRIEHISHSQG